MKIPVVCHDRFSSSSAGDLVGQFLGSLCLQYVAMDRSHPAVDVVLRESYVSSLEQQQGQAPCISKCSVGASVEEYNLLSEGPSKSLLSHESASLFHSASDHLDDAVEFWRKESSHLLASTGASSSSTELSESELPSAEVNPVTFEVVPPSTQDDQRSDMVATFRLSREHRATSRLSEDIDSASERDYSHSAICHSYSHSGGPPSPTTISVALERSFHPSEEACRSRVKLMCSFGGRIVSRPDDGKLKYVGGETRILAVNRAIGYSEFMSKMAHFYGQPLSLKYQLPHEHLDAFISISSDDDLQNMLEEYDKLELNGGVSRLRLFFFTSPVEHETQRVSRNDSEDHCSRSEQFYVDAINTAQEKISDNHRENDETGFRQADAADFSASRMHRVDSSTGLPWSVSPVKTFARVPSTPSSPPLSPSAAIRQAHLKPLRVGDSSFQVSKERLDYGTTADGSGSPSCASRVDYQYRKPSESPSSRTQHEISVSRGESWQIQAGMRRVNSQTRLMRPSEQQIDYGTCAGLTDVQQASEMPVPVVERQRFVYQPHNCIPQQQQLAWQSPMEGNLGRGETMQRRPSDVHIQPHAFHLPREAIHQLHQATQLCAHQTAADYDGRARDMEVQGVPSFLQGPSYQMGSAPPSPRITHDCKGRCNCAQQHSQVHRGINVCLNDQSYTRRAPQSGNLPNRKYGLPPHIGDQPTRKHGFPDSVGLCDNVPHCGERMTWLQQTSHFTPQEADTGNAWRQIPAQCHVAECKTINRGPQYCDSPLFTEAFLSSHDQCEMSKIRCVCSACYDGRREPVGLPVYIGMQDQVGGWVTHQRSLELDDGTTYNPGPVQTQLCRDGDWRGVPERSAAEGDLYCKNAQGKSKRPLAIAVGVPYHGNVTVRVLPKSPPLTPEDSHNPEASTTSSRVDVKRYSNLVTPKASPLVSSWTNPSIEASVWTDITPSPISYVPHVLSEEDFIKLSLSEEMPTTDSTTDSLLVKDRPSGLEKASAWKPLPKENRDQVQGRTAGESFVRDDTGRLNPASRASGEAATELLPVPSVTRNGFTNGCESDQTSPTDGRVHLLSQNVIPVGSLAHVNVASSSAQQAFAPGVSSMTLSEGLTSPTSPTYVRSPLNETGSTGLYLEPSKANLVKGRANLDKKGLMSSMSITGLLADGKISSVLTSCSNKEHCDGSRMVDHEVVDVKLKEAKKNETEQDTQIVIRALNSNSPFIEKGKDRSIKCSEAVNEWLKVSPEKEQLPGMVPVPHNGTTKKIVYEEKDVVVEIEGNGVALRQSEADARARGLQIIQNADLEDLRELGSGTFGTVFHGKWRGSDVAIKRIKASCFMGRPSEQERLISDFWKEARTLSQLHHPNIVALYGVVPDGPEGALATVTEYMVNGSLKKVLRKKDRTIDRRKRITIAMGAAFGMEYLHSKNIVHFDLKCDNLLVNMKDAQRPICKVGDFGLSKVKHRTMVSGGVRGTIPWMAPELLSCNSNMVTEKIDVFSFGIVMWELLTGEEPYANMHHGTIIGGIVKNTLRPSIPSWCEPGWRALMERCWSGDPADRPSFSEVATELRALAASINVR